MLALSEPELDRRLWGAPVPSRDELRAFDPAGASTEEVLLAAVAAARLGDRRELERLARAAHEREPEDPTVRTLVLLTDAARRLSARLGWFRATDAEVAELQSLAERSALARWTLVAMLPRRRDAAAAARRALKGCPPEQREAPSVAAAEVMIEPSPGVRLRRLRELRARWGPWASLLNFEVRNAYFAGDLEALEEAYRQRCALLGRRRWPGLARVWARAPHLGWLADVAVGVGIALSSPWVFLTAMAVSDAWSRLQAHVLDLNRIRSAWLGVVFHGVLAGYWLWAVLTGESVVGLGVALAVLDLGMFLWLTWDLHRTRAREGEAARTREVPAGSDG